jgi:hypothetical protein
MESICKSKNRRTVGHVWTSAGNLPIHLGGSVDFADGFGIQKWAGGNDLASLLSFTLLTIRRGTSTFSKTEGAQ